MGKAKRVHTWLASHISDKKAQQAENEREDELKIDNKDRKGSLAHAN